MSDFDIASIRGLLHFYSYTLYIYYAVSIYGLVMANKLDKSGLLRPYFRVPLTSVVLNISEFERFAQ
jgi:hypothetical protein